MRRLVALALATLALLGLAWQSLAADPIPAVASGPLTVLDNSSIWRIFHQIKPPVIQMDDGPKPVLAPADFGWVNKESPAAPEGWTKQEFDDSSWLRGSTLGFAYTPYLARLTMRTHFEVTDPAQVKGLKLTVKYWGGAIVYINGQELARGNVAKTGPVELAEGYSAETFASPEGKILPADERDIPAAVKAPKRERALTELAIPAAMLHQGVNTLAIEIIRAPYNKILEEKKNPKIQLDGPKPGSPYAMTWNTCQLNSVLLNAESGAGLKANIGRTKEWQAWNGDILTRDYETDVADRGAVLRPITIDGARNGWHSGKIVVGSAKAIEGLKAVVSELKQGSAAIPASAVRVRYGTSWGGGNALEALLEKPLDVFPAGKTGTVVPIWVTVKIPADTKPGTYTGQITITAKDEQPITADVKLNVADWTLPNQDDWKAWVELIESPDTLSLQYDVPLWSDKHWALMDQSLKYMGEISSRTLYVPLIAHTNFGNAESMVRWIKKADGSYDWDFSIMDKYLDMAQKDLGSKLKLVAFNVWEVYLFKPAAPVVITDADRKDDYTMAHKGAAALRWENREKGPVVTALDAATGKTESINLPRFENPAAKPIWKALFVELRKRMAKRGLEDAMAVAMISDIWPNKEENATIAEVTGNLPWVNHTHGGGYRYTLGPVKYTAYVWDTHYGPEPSKGRNYGWKFPKLEAEYLRFDYMNRWPLASILRIEELEISGQQRGLGRIGGDFWPVIKDKKGVGRGWVADRYPEVFWHSLNMGCGLLVPGPTGPVASARYEVFREGVQQCEARIAMEQVLTDAALKAKLPADLAQKCQDVLDQRVRETWLIGSQMRLPAEFAGVAGLPIYHGTYEGGTVGQVLFAGSGWRERSRQFYEMAGDVANKAGAK